MMRQLEWRISGWLIGLGLMLAGPNVLWAQATDWFSEALAQKDSTGTVEALKEQHAEVLGLQEQGRFSEALEASEALATSSEQAFGREDRVTLAALDLQARLIFRLGDHRRARELQQMVVDLSYRHLGTDDRFTLAAEFRLVHSLHWLGERQNALARAERIFQVRRQSLGDEHPDTIRIHAKTADLLHNLGQYREAHRRYEEALEPSRRVLGEGRPETLSIGKGIGLSLLELGKLQDAKEQLEDVLAISRRSLGNLDSITFNTLGDLAWVLLELGDLQTAMKYQRQVVADSTQAVGAHHQWTLAAQGNLSKTLALLGYLEESQQLQEELLKLEMQMFGERFPTTLGSFNNLAVMLQRRGDLQGAKKLFEHVLAIGPDVLGTDHPNLLLTQAHLAALHRTLGDLKTARYLAEKTLVTRQRLQGPDHQETLRAQVKLADILLALGDIDSATEHFESILEIRQSRLGAEHPETLMASLGVSRARKALGDLTASQALDTKSFQLSRQILGPQHPDTLKIQAHLADTYRRLDHPQEARDQYLDVLQHRSQLRGDHAPPSTEEEAHEFFGLGRTLQDLEEPADALQSFITGLDTLEAQTLRVDPAESVKSRYISNYGFAYKEALDVGLDANRLASAFWILERYRTQSLLALLRWNREALGQGIPKELATELHRLGRRYDWLIREQDRIYPETHPEWAAEQEQIRRRREVIQGDIVAARRAQGDLPEPLQAGEVQSSLDAGTLLLSFSIGEDTSHLFALTRESLHAVQLDVTSHVLTTQVDRLRALDLDAEDSQSRQGLSSWLYKHLLAPVEPQIQDAQRVLILPDGPLHFLPFAALTRSSTDTPRGWQYLAQWKPIHSVQSATVYRELVTQRTTSAGSKPPWKWVGIGHPTYPTVTDATPSNLPDAVRSTTERGIWGGLTPLPHTEREIRGIAQLFPQDRVQPLLHRDATEDRARQVLGNASIVHFAAHGLADPDYPMDSFLALSLEDGDFAEHNGLLQAWEIADHLHLDADLVVLSACVTALGPNQGGEGLISLSRAFQIAGARSVLASLWSVNDLSTSELMLRFYRHFQAGASKDRALQLAQQELIRGPVEVTLEDGSVVERDFSSPYHWAAFQLIGDWR